MKRPYLFPTPSIIIQTHLAAIKRVTQLSDITLDNSSWATSTTVSPAIAYLLYIEDIDPLELLGENDMYPEYKGTYRLEKLLAPYSVPYCMMLALGSLARGDVAGFLKKLGSRASKIYAEENPMPTLHIEEGVDFYFQEMNKIILALRSENL